MEKTTMSVRELAERMGISLPMAYDLTRRVDFPSIRVGARILIPAVLGLWNGNGNGCTASTFLGNV